MLAEEPPEGSLPMEGLLAKRLVIEMIEVIEVIEVTDALRTVCRIWCSWLPRYGFCML